MKFLFSIFLALPSFAVQTRYCPETLKLESGEITVFSKSFIYSIASRLDTADYEAIDFALNGPLNKWDWEFELQSRADSKCWYRSKDDKISATLEGPDRDPLLFFNYSVENSGRLLSYFVKTQPNEKRPFYGFSGATAQIRVRGSYRDWGEQIIRWIPVGKTVIQ